MLEGIVQEDDFGRVVAHEQFPDAIHTVLIHSNLNRWILFEILQWFVAQVFVSACRFGVFEAFCLSAIASTQRSNVVMVFQYIDKVLRVWRFSCSAQVEVAHTD